ncbi:MAG: 16S rRNA (guanine(527)-N(7))-methyltransferase RsmG, partial [Chloroflexota bacterium]
MLEDARAFGVELDDEQLRQFDRYRDELLDWNQRVNLTAITDPVAVERLHFVDSLACLLEPFPSGARVLDVGAGAGLPGLALKIARSDLDLTLLEATGKKARFLEHVVGTLGLDRAHVVAERAESFTDRESFDIVLARALAALPALLELTLPFCRVGGKVLALKKGAGLAAELDSAAQALQVLGGELAEPRTYDLEGEQSHVVVVVKVRPT